MISIFPLHDFAKPTTTVEVRDTVRFFSTCLLATSQSPDFYGSNTVVRHGGRLLELPSNPATQS